MLGRQLCNSGWHNLISTGQQLGYLSSRALCLLQATAGSSEAACNKTVTRYAAHATLQEMAFLESASSNPFRNLEKSGEDFLDSTVFAPHRSTNSSTLDSQPAYTTMQRKGRFSVTTEMHRPSCLLQQASSISKAGDTAAAAVAAASKLSSASLDTTPSGGSSSSMGSATNSYLDGMSDGLTSDIQSICSSPVSISSSADTHTTSSILSPLASPICSQHSAPAVMPLSTPSGGSEQLPMGPWVHVANSGRFRVTTTSPMAPTQPVPANPSQCSNSATLAGTASAAAAPDLVSVLVTATSVSKTRTVVMFSSRTTAASGVNAAGADELTRRYQPMPTVHNSVTYTAGRFTVTEAVLFGPHWPYPRYPLEQMAAAATAAAARRQRDSSSQTAAVCPDLVSKQATAAGTPTAPAAAAAATPTAVVSAAGAESVTAEVIIAAGKQKGAGKGFAWVFKVFGKHG
jgi:hypothetical protein